MSGKEDSEQPRHTPRAKMTGLSTSLAGQVNRGGIEVQKLKFKIKNCGRKSVFMTPRAECV